MDTDVEMADAQRVPVDEISLKTYYYKAFPAELICKWLNYCTGWRDSGVDQSYMKRREFACEINSKFFRYISFKDGTELRKFLYDKCPLRLDIGPVYNADLSLRNVVSITGCCEGGGHSCVERELIFDVDMNDYDDVRTCCKEGNICEKDWSFMAAAIKVIDDSLREDFGFEHILWVYSGRRGVHGWVCDKRARVLPNEVRSSISDFLTIHVGMKNGAADLNLKGYTHPFIRRSLQTCRQIWVERILSEQQLFEYEDKTEAIYTMFNSALRPELRQESERLGNDGVKIWRSIEDAIDKLKKSSTQQSLGELKDLEEGASKVILAHVFPRLDGNVTRSMNHLLKAPFCVHPKTGKICVPIDVNNLWDFNPESVPTVAQLYQEIEDMCKTNQEFRYEDSVLGHSISVFLKFIEGMNPEDCSSN